jgi:hypothetical protein
LNTKLSGPSKSGTWTSRWAEQKGKFRLLNLRNEGKRLTIVPSYIKKEPKDGTTSKSRSSNSSWEIRYFSLTLTFVYLVMVSFVVSGKARTKYCMSWITAQSPSNVMMGIHSRQMTNALNYSLSQTPRISRKWKSSISSSYNDYIHRFFKIFFLNF